MGGSLFVSLAVLLLLQLNSHVVTGDKVDNNKCDIYEGRWVFDDSGSYPLYNSSRDCPFIEQREFDCQKNGRPDTDYLKYRWQPTACNLPRFDGGDFLSRLRGKSILFVGDSLSLNQWQSLTCMLHRAVPKANYTLRRDGNLSTFTFHTYNTRVMFIRNQFLVEIANTSSGRALKLDSISIENDNMWRTVDVLILDSWHWWIHTGRKQPWDFIELGNEKIKDMDRLAAFEKGLTTWANWVDSNINQTKTRVFFQGVSPDHLNGADWGQTNGTCVAQTEPIFASNYPAGTHEAEIVVEKVISKMSKPVHLLNVTRLSQLRKDGHPSLYGFSSKTAPDCSHWCLPGVPDIWNELLYAGFIEESGSLSEPRSLPKSGSSPRLVSSLFRLFYSHWMMIVILFCFSFFI